MIRQQFRKKSSSEQTENTPAGGGGTNMFAVEHSGGSSGQGVQGFNATGGHVTSGSPAFGLLAKQEP